MWWCICHVRLTVFPLFWGFRFIRFIFQIRSLQLTVCTLQVIRLNFHVRTSPIYLHELPRDTPFRHESSFVWTGASSRLSSDCSLSCPLHHFTSGSSANLMPSTVCWGSSDTLKSNMSDQSIRTDTSVEVWLEYRFKPTPIFCVNLNRAWMCDKK